MSTGASPGDGETRATNLAILGETLRLSCVELMADYGLGAAPSDGASLPAPPVSVLVAGVDFKGRELRGTVALRATRDVIMQTKSAAPGLDAGPDDLVDWTCELANQLIGRMKNKLRAFDVSLSLNVPRLIVGKEVAELDEALRYRFSCEFGVLSAYLDVLIAPGFMLSEREPGEALVQEGDVELF